LSRERSTRTRGFSLFRAAPVRERLASPGVYWQTGDEDAAMQAEHGFMWRALLDTVDVDVRGRRALDAGCNQGGFLRLLCDERGIASGYGYDPAAGRSPTPAGSPARAR